jgi:hypothetical protein
MNVLAARSAITEPRPPAASRRVVHRARGSSHGPITRLVSPSDLGELIKPFVFLDHSRAGGGAVHSITSVQFVVGHAA